jgi:hypothetical protein
MEKPLSNKDFAIVMTIFFVLIIIVGFVAEFVISSMFLNINCYLTQNVIYEECLLLFNHRVGW